MWYFQNEDAADGPHDDVRFAELIHSGAIKAATLVWTQGMDQWAPAEDTRWADSFHSGPSSLPPPMPMVPPQTSAALSGYKTPAGLARVISLLLILSIVAELAWALSSASQLELLGRIHRHGQFTMAEARASDACQRALSGVHLALFIFTAIFFARCVLISARNVRAFGARNLQFTPGWAVGYYFIPVLSLWKPFQAMEEIWRASASPELWEHEKSGALLGCWWTFWILANVVGQVVIRLSDPDTTMAALMVANIANIVLDILAMMLIRGLAARQIATAARLQA